MSRQVDALVAEKIMEWPITFPGSFCDDGVYVSKPIAPGHFTHTVVPFRPSTDITYAWMVLEKVLAGPHAEEFVGRLFLVAGGWKHRTDTELLLKVLRYLSPATICEMALKVYGVAIPEEDNHE